MQKPISTTTQFCVVIGNPISHSLSPAIHNGAFCELGLDFVYLACQVENVKDALTGMRALGNFRGMSITIPHKIEAMKYVDEIDTADQAIGSINTVIKEEDRLLGFGTDGPGALKALNDAGVNIDGKNIVMIGAGGASRAIAFTLALKTQFSNLTLMDIDEALLSQLSQDLTDGTNASISSAVFTEQSLRTCMETADLIIHCTPVGMHPKENDSLVPIDLFQSHHTVFDVVYTPLKTKLLQNAQAKGAKTISGVEMFVNQAVLQFERFTGQKAPVDIMRQVVMEQLNK